MDKYYVYRPLLDLISFTEGTGKARGYNETLAYGAYTGGDVDLISMTLAQVDVLQIKMLRHKKNTLKSSACGLYQIVRTTLRKIKDDLDLEDTELFDESMQDRMACYLLGIRGVDKYLAGRLKEDTLIDNLAKEWASLPTTAGKGYYGGQHAAVTPAKVRGALKEMMKRHKEGQPKVEVPVAPPQIDKPVTQTTGFWERIITILGSGGAGFAAWFTDYRVVLAIAALVIVVALGGLFLHNRIITAVKDIKKAVNDAP